MSQLQKHEREVLKGVRALHDDIRAWYDKRGANTHPLLLVEYDGMQVQTRISCSPGVHEKALQQLLTRKVRQLFAERGVVL